MSITVGAALALLAGPAAAHGSALVVQLTTTGASTGSLTVNARVTHVDGDAAVAARVQVVATAPNGQVRTARLVETSTPGGYRALLPLAPGRWQLVVGADAEGTEGRASATVVVGGVAAGGIAPSRAVPQGALPAADPAPAGTGQSQPPVAALAGATALLAATGAALVVRRTRRGRSVGR